MTATPRPAVTRPRVAGERSRRPGRPDAPESPAPRPERARPPARRVLRGRWTLAVLAVLTAAAVTAAVLLTVSARREQALADARTAAVEQARSAAEVVLSYSHETLDEDFAAALDLATGDFAEEYRRTSEEAVRPVATETRAVVEADVVSAGVVSSSPDRVVVLLFVNQTTTSTRLDAPRTDQNRVRMTMSRVDGRWLVSAVDAL